MDRGRECLVRPRDLLLNPRGAPAQLDGHQLGAGPERCGAGSLAGAEISPPIGDVGKALGHLRPHGLHDLGGDDARARHSGGQRGICPDVREHLVHRGAMVPRQAPRHLLLHPRRSLGHRALDERGYVVDGAAMDRRPLGPARWKPAAELPPGEGHHLVRHTPRRGPPHSDRRYEPLNPIGYGVVYHARAMAVPEVVGPGRVLTALLKRILDGAVGFAVEDPAGLEKVLASKATAS